jgi:hypothetical protein
MEVRHDKRRDAEICRMGYVSVETRVINVQPTSWLNSKASLRSVSRNRMAGASKANLALVEVKHVCIAVQYVGYRKRRKTGET